MSCRTSNHLRYQVIWYETLWKVQARDLDPVAHPRAIQPLDQNTEVRLKDNYYVASLFLRPINFLRNWVILMWNHDIPNPLQIHLYFQWVRPTRNIMHESLTFCGPWFIHNGRWNMNRGFFTFWAGSLHFFGAMWDGRFMHETWNPRCWQISRNPDLSQSQNRRLGSHLESRFFLT